MGGSPIRLTAARARLGCSSQRPARSGAKRTAYVPLPLHATAAAVASLLGGPASSTTTSSPPAVRALP
jgi:hypothetical protein